MAAKSKSSRKNSTNPFFPNFAENSRGVWQELHHLVYFAGALIVFLSLLSHSPADPSWSTWSTRVEISNWIGRLGSTASDILIQLFGLGAFCFPVALLIAGIKKQADERQTLPGISAFCFASFVLASSTLFHLGLTGSALPWDLSLAGGMTGSGLGNASVYLLGQLGTLILCLALITASILLAFEWQFLTARASALLSSALFLVKSPKKLFLLGAVRLTPVAVFLRKLIFRRKEKPLVPAEPVIRSYESEDVSEVDEEPKKRLIDRIPFVQQDKDEDFERASKVAPKQSTGGKQLRMPLVHRDFQLPSTSFLSGKSSKKGTGIDKQWYVEKGELLVEKLADFGVDGEIVNVAPGPVITVYEFKPASGIKIREIANLSDDLTLALSVLSVRIVAPIPGKPVVGIEIPTPEREVVYFKDIVQETGFYKNDRRIPIALGRLASGEPILADLASMPHLLVAGATGTGKSVFVNTLICSLLYRFAPQQLKLILVDPKMVELSLYDGIPHLMLPVVVEAKKAVLALRWLVDEMERRYKVLHQSGVRHIDGYNAKLNEMQKKGEALEEDFLPYIVTVIDEYADLMAVVSKEVEHSVTRLAQKARAAGIHLVLATQRPSTDVVTGTIKANFPSRISFRVASGVDSKTILDRPGAERLLGNGDMLFHSAGFNTLKRMQGSYIDDRCLETVITHLKDQAPPQYDEDILADVEAADEEDADGDNKEGALYDQAVKLVTDRGEASISLIQRHLRIGYNRAATLMEQMEKEGVVGAPAGASKRRTVLVNSL